MMEYIIMEYKSYIAKVRYSEEDKCICGKVTDLEHSLILIEGETLKEVKKDFKEAIDLHLESCKEDGMDSERKGKGSSMVRIISNPYAKIKNTKSIALKNNAQPITYIKMSQ